jgi:hypothetical protein
MSVSEISPQDGVAFARSIRLIARDARDRLQGSTSNEQFVDLLDRIEWLEEQARVRQSDDLTRWLSSLRKKVEDQVMAAI